MNRTRSAFQMLAVVALLLGWKLPAYGQISSTAPTEGLRENPPGVHALVNARLIIAPGRVIEQGCLVVREGVITEVGPDVKPPTEARVWDLAGCSVYAGFIDSYSRYGLSPKDRPKPLRPEKARPGERPKPAGEDNKSPGGASWNPLVTPQKKADELFTPDPKEAEKMRALGFTSALVVPGRGVFRGESALVDLSGRATGKSLLREAVAQHIAFQLSDDSERSYPGSLMGCIALVRQTFLDTDWYERASRFATDHPAAGPRPETNAALAALARTAKADERAVFEADDELDVLRALRLADEFRLKPILRGSGREYRLLEPLKRAAVPVVLTLDFPEAPAVETPESALDVTLEALEYWQEAPANPACLARAGVMFVLSTDKLDDPSKKFWPNLHASIKRGLQKDDALAALTTVPARLLGMEGKLGSLEKGKSANFIVTDGDLFTEENAGVTAVWIDGEYHATERGERPDPRGTFALSYSESDIHGPDSWRVEGENTEKLKGSAADISVDVRVVGESLVALVPAKLFGAGEGTVRLSTDPINGHGGYGGSGQLPDGRFFRWSARKTTPFEGKPEPASSSPEIPLPAAYPAGAYGRSLEEKPESGIVLVQNATLWTCGPQGKIENGSLLIENGKIKAVGDNVLAPAGAKIIDAAGRPVTPGLVDAHSHTAISRGVNEATHAVTCEVRIGDVLDSTDIALYRELAGGLTVANVLHGSANPIGGQCQPIKLRWGGLPEDLKIAGAMPGVKFALGENVKQSNWGDRFTVRYPQTRMGVEEIMRDTFLAAREYERDWSGFRDQPAGSVMPPRRNLRLEAALEILNRQRIIHIHSYRQDEISMFAHLAKEFGLTVAAFHHGLECYKVADEVAAIGAGVSTFSDWWAYKEEVIDAIPYNGAMLTKQGVLTSFNSDSNELARRLNTEAAKAVKYGGLSEEEALKFVTINPARQLRLEAQLGSLEPGKDADFVIWAGPADSAAWNGSPLSAYAHAQQTWIDGKCYFDFDQDAQMQKMTLELREKLIQAALGERLKAMQKASSKAEDKKKESGDSTQDKPTALDRLLLHRAIHRAWEQQGVYHGGLDRHNCSNADFF